MYYIFPYMYVMLPTNAACCPDINNEDVVSSKKIGEIAEKNAYAQFAD